MEMGHLNNLSKFVLLEKFTLLGIFGWQIGKKATSGFGTQIWLANWEKSHFWIWITSGKRSLFDKTKKSLNDARNLQKFTFCPFLLWHCLDQGWTLKFLG